MHAEVVTYNDPIYELMVTKITPASATTKDSGTNIKSTKNGNT